MKKKITGLVIIAFICVFTLSAFKKYYANYQVIGCGTNTANNVSGELLELTTGTLQKGKGKATSTYSIDGTKAMLERFKIGDQCFEVIASTGQAAPTNYVSLYKLTVGKTNRSFTMNNDGSASTDMITVQLVSIDTSPGHYKVFLGPGASLFPGEYAFIDKTTITTDGKIKVWSFGIDQ